MKRKFFALLLALALLLSLAISVSADVLWEPVENDYYDSHRQEMDGVGRIYFVPEGMTVDLYESPESGKLLDTLEAGARIHIGFSVEEGDETWGVGYPLDDWKANGWCRLGRLQLEYDSQAFAEDFGESFTNYEGQMEGYEVKDKIYVWTYPGSGVQDGYISEIDPGYNDGKLECGYVYTDPEGGEWGYVGYYMGRRDWIYLSDPENPTPPSFPQTPESTVTDASPTEEAPSNTGAMVRISLMVLGIVALTALLIYRLKRKKGTPPT